MASVQAPRPSAVATLSDKDKAATSEAVKHAKSVLSKNANDLQLVEKVTVGGAMMNADELVIMVHKTHDFAGHFTVNPSATIGSGHLGEFVHQGKGYPHPLPNEQSSMHYGSSGVVVYGYCVNNVSIVRGWLLAWSVLDNEHHVYVEAGTLEKMMKTSMEEVRLKLKASGTTSYYVDWPTGAEASATITPDGNTAALGSVFGVRRLLGPN